MKKKVFLLLLFTSSFTYSSTSIKLNNIKEYKITKEKVLYKIEAKSKNIHYKKLKKFRFFNKEKVVSNSSYYLNGNFSSKDLKISFKKAYFLEGKFIMLESKGFYKTSPFKAKKAIFSRSDLFLKNVRIKLGNRNYKKFKYKIKFN